MMHEVCKAQHGVMHRGGAVLVAQVVGGHIDDRCRWVLTALL